MKISKRIDTISSSSSTVIRNDAGSELTAFIGIDVVVVVIVVVVVVIGLDVDDDGKASNDRSTSCAVEGPEAFVDDADVVVVVADVVVVIGEITGSSCSRDTAVVDERVKSTLNNFYSK